MMINRTLMAIALLAACLSAAAGTLISGKPLPSSTTQYDLSVNSVGQHSPAHMAGERAPDSTTGTDYLAAGIETKCTAVDTATDSTTVYNGPARLYGVYVNTVLSAHTVVISDNSTAKFTLPASLAAGTNIPLPGARFDTSLIVDPNDSSTGNITVCYAPLDPTVTW